MADSLARHFADWGAASRSLTGGGEGVTIKPLHFEDDIKPLFRERATAIRCASRFDLWSLEDVSTHASPSSSGSRPARCHATGRGPAEQIAAFRGWIDAGRPA